MQEPECWQLPGAGSRNGPAAKGADPVQNKQNQVAVLAGLEQEMAGRDNPASAPPSDSESTSDTNATCNSGNEDW